MKYKVLLVDNDINGIDAYAQHLRSDFYVTTVQGNDQGLSAVEDLGPYAVIVSGFNTPIMKSLEFFEKAKKISPEASFVLIAEPDHWDIAIRAVNERKVFCFLLKPLKQHVLSKTLNSGITQFVKNSKTIREVIDQNNNPLFKKILIVDDDPIIRAVLSGALKNHKTLKILTAENGQVASKLLSIIKIDLVITDLEMPIMNGSALLFFMNKHYPEIPVIILTWFFSEELERKNNRFGSFQYLEKPLEIPRIAEMIFKELNGGEGGKIQGISTANFLQLVEMEEKSCVLTVRSSRKIGWLFFQKGGLVDAETDGLKGEQAAYEIIGWEDSSIEIGNARKTITKNINKPLMLILMETKRIKDELGWDAKNELFQMSETIGSPHPAL